MDLNKQVVDNVEDLIGNTPCVKLSKVSKDIKFGQWLKEQGHNIDSFSIKSDLYAKVEFLNPGGSVKDRIAVEIMNGLEASGKLKPGGTIVEATSGNTGAGLALCAANRGYKSIFVMPDKISAEKINALRAFGAKVVMCPTEVHPDDPNYYCEIAKKIANETPGAALANQYFNADNPLAHYKTTAPEIWDQMGSDLDAFICGIGTGGTISGIGKYLKEKNPNIKIVAIDPYGSLYHDLITKDVMGEPSSYLVEGVGEDMIPETMDLKMPDSVVQVNDAESFYMTHRLAQEQSLLVGGSCGFAVHGALQWLYSEEQKQNKKLKACVLLPDSGSRYLSKVFNLNWLTQGGLKKELFSGCGPVEFVGNAKQVEGL